jgi:hypothetical protein
LQQTTRAGRSGDWLVFDQSKYCSDHSLYLTLNPPSGFFLCLAADRIWLVVSSEMTPATTDRSNWFARA